MNTMLEIIIFYFIISRFFAAPSTKYRTGNSGRQ